MFTDGDVVLVRTYSAGVWYGTLESRVGREVILSSARRLWSWSGATECSELAMKGVANPQNCKFPAPVSEVLLLEAIEIIPVTIEAQLSLDSVPIWTAHK